MKVLIHTALAGEGFSHSPGEIVDIDEAEGARWINAGYASPATPLPPVEKRERKAKG